MHLPFLFTSSWQSMPWNPDWHEHEMALSDVGKHVPPFKHFMYWHGFLSFSQFKPKYWGVQSHFLSLFSELHLPPFLQGDDSQGSAKVNSQLTIAGRAALAGRSASTG